MVKSYTGAREIPKKQAPQHPPASAYMTKKLITFSPDQPIGEVAQILMKKNISGGPVLNAQGELVGIISEGDCLKEIVRGKYLNSPNHSGLVSDHMARKVITIEPDMSVLEVAGLFLSEKVRRFPVLDKGKLVGQISQRDVLRAISELKNETW